MKFRNEPYNYVATIPLKNDGVTTIFLAECLYFFATIPLKNDGVTTPNHSTWNKNDNIYSNDDNNFYYDDNGDGGYNHLEIRRVKRLYTPGANKKGDLAIPMRETRQWIEREVTDN